MTTSDDERFQREADACLERRAHFCTCTDHACPLNPHNPRNVQRGRGCDACIRKCLALGEIPSCFFKEVGETPAGWDDYSYAGFVRHCLGHEVGSAQEREA